jgi:molecular chaperone DnaK
MTRLGLDLGSTAALASFVTPQGVPTLVPDSRQANEFRTPAVVHFEGDVALVGQSAEAALLDSPGMQAARCFKWALGSGKPMLSDERGRKWSSEGLTALLIRKLLMDLEAAESETAEGVVVAVPASFSESQRQATRMAVQMAGVSNVALVDEPVAAAQFYGLSRSSAEQTVMVYDFGGGSVDATVLHVADGKLSVLATEGNPELGGLKVDALVSELIAREFRRAHGVDPTADAASRDALRRSAEELKLGLMTGGRGHVRKTLLLAGRALDFALTRDQFNLMTQPLVDESVAACQRCLHAAGLDWGAVDRIFLTGGSSQLPTVLRRLAMASGRTVEELHSRQPYAATAYGAALVADAGSQESRHMALNSVAPCHLGLRVRDPLTGQPRFEPLIKRNTPLPATHTATFYTTRPDQTRIILDIVQSKDGESIVDSLGLVAFGPIRRPQKNYPVEVTVSYNSEGMARVQARDPVSGETLERSLLDNSDPNAARLAQERAWLGGISVNG